VSGRVSRDPTDHRTGRLPPGARRAVWLLLLLGVVLALRVILLDRPIPAPRMAPAPPTTCQGVRVTPTANLQSLIDANPPRTTFCFAQGLYRLSRSIQTRDKFPVLDLRAGAVIDGGNGGFSGIISSDPPPGQPGVRVLGGVFQHFGNATAPGWVSPMVVRDNSVVEGTEFRENFNSGLAIQGDHARVSNVFSHHNGRYGLNLTRRCSDCPGVVGAIVEDSEIAFNNTRRLGTAGSAGGTKFCCGSNGVIVRRNEVHDNYGSGLWFDGDHTNVQIYENIIYDNRNWGIMYEISLGGAKIHHNTLTGNGLSDGTTNWFNAVQLLVSCSDGSTGGIEIYENTIDGTAHPLALIDHDHNGDSTRTRGVYVHHNTMTLRASTTRVGAVAFGGLTELFRANNRFDHNTYRVPTTAGRYWAWNGQILTWNEWQAYGHDANGAVVSTS
jgi:hypothetical protein